jgi:hypothetical protein
LLSAPWDPRAFSGRKAGLADHADNASGSALNLS